MNEPINVGLMVPINNTTMEVELLAWLPKGSTCKTVKIPRGAGLLNREKAPAYVAQAVKLSEDFAQGNIDVLAFGCTAASFVCGPQAEVEMQRALAKASTRPTVTTARSMLDSLKAIGARNVAVLNPYSDEVNRGLAEFLESEQMKIARLSSFKAATVDELGKITSAQVYEKAQALMAEVGGPCDALFIACSQLPTRDILEPLRQALKIPVMSSIQVTAEQALLACAKVSV